MAKKPQAPEATVELGYMLPALTEINNTLPRSETFYWQGIDNTNSLELVQTLMKTDETASDSSHSMPDMLMHSLNFERQLLGEDPVRRQAALDQWLGIVAALALSRGDLAIKMVINLKELINDTGASYFLRAAAKSFVRRGSPIDSITIYLMKQDGEAALSSYVPVAFSYPGMKTYIAPAAEISYRLKDSPEWYGMEEYQDTTMKPARQRERGVFSSPAHYFAQQANAADHHSFYNGLTALAGSLISTNRGELGKLLQEEALPKLRPDLRIRVLDAAALNTDLLPEMKVIAVDPPVGPSRFLTNTLLLVSKKPNLDYSKMYGRMTIENDAQHDAFLPLTESFARELASKSAQDRSQILSNLYDDLTITRIQETVIKGGVTDIQSSYRVDWQWNGESYQKIYDQDSYLIPTQRAWAFMPAVAVWPDKEDPTDGWKQYYLYYKYDQAASWQNLQLAVIDDEIIRPIHVRIPSGDTRDYVVSCEKFPQYVSVQYEGTHVGLLLPKSNGAAGNVAARGTRVIGLDFGTTSTVAFYRDDPGDAPQIASIYPATLTVAGFLNAENKTTDVQRSYLPLDFATPDLHMVKPIASILNVHVSTRNQITPFDMANLLILNPGEIAADEEHIKQFRIDLKIDESADMLHCVQAYLQHLVLLLLWQAYTSGFSDIEWRFSYPKSFSGTRRQNFKENVQGLLQNLRVPAMMFDVRSDSYITESEAIGEFINAESLVSLITNNKYVATSEAGGYLFIDIGGGTVDFSLWQDKTLKAEASFLKCAGNYVLCDFITHAQDTDIPPRIELLKTIDSGPPSQLRGLIELLEKYAQERGAEYLKQFRTHWQFEIDIITSRIQNLLPQIGANEYRLLRQYQYMIEMYVGMVLFFAGMLAGSAMKAELFTVSKDEVLSILLTGNGAQMISLLDSKATKTTFLQSKLYARLQVLFNHGMERGFGKPCEARSQIIYPFKPKEEVAYGLTCMKLASAPVMQHGINADVGIMMEKIRKAKEAARKAAEGDVLSPEEKNLSWIEQSPDKTELEEAMMQFWDVFKNVQESCDRDFGNYLSQLFGKSFGESSLRRQCHDLINSLTSDSLRSMDAAFTGIIHRYIAMVVSA